MERGRREQRRDGVGIAAVTRLRRRSAARRQRGMKNVEPRSGGSSRRRSSSQVEIVHARSGYFPGCWPASSLDAAQRESRVEPEANRWRKSRSKAQIDAVLDGGEQRLGILTSAKARRRVVEAANEFLAQRLGALERGGARGVGVPEKRAQRLQRFEIRAKASLAPVRNVRLSPRRRRERRAASGGGDAEVSPRRR